MKLIINNLFIFIILISNSVRGEIVINFLEDSGTYKVDYINPEDVIASVEFYVNGTTVNSAYGGVSTNFSYNFTVTISIRRTNKNIGVF